MTGKHRNVRPDTLPADPKWLVIEASDGSPNTWPKNTESIPDESQQYNFMKPLDIADGPSVRWRKDIGQKLAEMLGHTDSKSWVLKDWPSGYRLFDHHKGSINSMRHDLYLFGSSAASKFRSVNEFIPHAYWLIKDGGRNNDACQCKYCSKNPSQRDISFALNLSHRSAGPARVVEVPRLNKLKKHKLRMLREGRVSGITRQKQKFEKLPEGPKFASSAEREKDIWAFLGPKSYGVCRWAREGELVWVKLNHSISLARGNGLDANIDFWPGLIEDVRLKTIAVPKPPETEVMDQDGLDGPESSDLPWTIVHFPIFKIELLVSSKTVVVEQEAIIPYQAHAPPMPLMKAVESFLFNVDKFEGASQPADSSKAVSSQESSSSDVGRNALRDRFEDFDAYPDTPFKGSTIQEMIAYNETAAGSYALAIETASRLTSFWTPTDVWHRKLIPPYDGSDAHFSDGLNPEELQAMGRKLLGSHHLTDGGAYQRRFQGLWWGPERIWYGDLIRLKPPRQQFVPDGNEVIKKPYHSDDGSKSMSNVLGSSADTPLCDPSLFVSSELGDVKMEDVGDGDNGAGPRALFMLVDSFFSASVPREDLKGIEDDCRMVGTLYELAGEGAISEDESPLEASFQLPSASTFFAPNADLLSELPSDFQSGQPSGVVVQNSVMNVDTTMPASVAEALATSSEPLMDLARREDPFRKADIKLPLRPPGQEIPLPPAPTGLKFRPVLCEGYEAVFPLSMLAGRYYPSLLTSSPLRNYMQLKDLKAAEHNYLWALDGLVAGIHNAVDPVVFLPRRSEMMRRGERDAWMQLAEHWRQKWRSEEARNNAIHID